MTESPEPPTLTAARRKARAAIRLDRAVAEIEAAHAELAPVEGAGYAEAYQQCPELVRQVEQLARRLRTLPPPTGLFEW